MNIKKIIFAIILLKLFSFDLYANDAWIIKNFPDSVNIVDIAVNSINEIFVATIYQPNPDVWPSGLFYYSSDDGNSWAQLLEVGLEVLINQLIMVLVGSERIMDCQISFRYIFNKPHWHNKFGHYF